MKKIIIYQNGVEPIEIKDSDNKDIQEYTKEISSLMESDNVTIIETSEGCLILRPTKILGIKVCEEQILKEERVMFIQEDVISDL